ncbi:MAG: PQQ-dependent sugar dehydrogenase [Chitinophagales bacterium]
MKQHYYFSFKSWFLVLVILSTIFITPPIQAQLPADFSDQLVNGSLNQVVGVAFDANGRMFAWEKGGKVYVFNNSGNIISTLIDIGEEVGNWRDHGMNGFALDPNFLTNGYFYLYYLVDRHHLKYYGTGNYSSTTNEYYSATIMRVTRYTANSATNFTTTVAGSRNVILGATASTGIPCLHESHTVGSLVFGKDGTLLISSGDGASYSSTDVGSASETYWSQAIADGIIRPEENVGAFRSQMVNSYNGKILRINPATGAGIPSNPFYDAGNPNSAKSKVYSLGLRNPFRFTLRPNTGSTNPADGNPGHLYIGDVGWSTWEDLHVATEAGQNFGWPIFEGLTYHSGYNNALTPNKDAPNPLYGTGGCTQQFFYFQNLIKQETPTNSGNFANPCNSGQNITNVPTFFHDRPKIDWRHGNSPARTGTFSGNTATETNLDAGSSPIGGSITFGGNAAVGGAWYTDNQFPVEYQNTYFQADYGKRWIKNFDFDGNNTPTYARNFYENGPIFVDIEAHPFDGSLYFVNYPSEIRKITYTGNINLPPTAIASANPSNGSSPLNVQFTGNQSNDPENGPLSYYWTFGDDNCSTGKQILFVVGNTSLNNGDAAAKKRLEALGHTVTVVSAPTSQTSNANGKNLVVISSTCNSSDVNTKFRDTPVPVLVWEPFLFDDMKMTSTSTSTYGSINNQTQLTIANSNHFIASALTGNQTIAKAASTLTWGTPAPTASKIATIVGNSSQAVIFAYNAGDQMQGLTAPARRVGFYFSDATASEATTTSWTLFTAAVTYALGCDGGASTIPNPNHTYTSATPTAFTAKLMVTDNQNLSNSTTTNININNTAPNVAITSVADGSLFSMTAPTVYTLAANVNDAESSNNQLTYAWQTFLLHANHSHPEPIDNNPTTTTTVTPVGCDGEFYGYAIVLTVTDPSGLSGRDSITVLPDCSTVAATTISASSNPATVGQNVIFTASNPIIATAPQVNYLWDFGDGNTSTDAMPSHSFNAANNYNVTVDLSDGDGHPIASTASYSIEVNNGTSNGIDLELSMTANPLQYTIFTNNLFTLTLTNNGDDTATGVTVSVPFPSQLAYTSSTVSQGNYVVWTKIWNVGTLPSGESATLDLNLFVLNTTANLTLLAQVKAANETDVDSTPDNNTTQTPIEDDEAAATITSGVGGNQNVDIELTLNASVSEAAIGDQFSYTLNVTNKGPGNATNVKAAFPIPTAFLQFLNSTNNQTTYNANTGEWNIGNLNANVTRTLLVNVQVIAEGVIAATGEVTSTTQTDVDSTPNNGVLSEDDMASVTVLPSGNNDFADLQLTKTASVANADIGDSFSYTLTITNNGPANAGNVSVEDLLPSGLTFNTSSASLGSYNSNTGLWTIGTLTNGSSETLTINVTVVNIAAAITNFAQVETSDKTDPDSTVGNDTNNTPNEDDEAAATVNPPATGNNIDLELDIVCNVSEFNLYQNITYTVSVTNKGPATATGITVANALPAGLAFTSKTESQGNFNFWGGLWTVGSLNAGATATLDIVLFTLNNSAAITNFAQVKAANENDSDSTPNNSSGVPTEDDEGSVTIIPAGSSNNQIDLALSKTASVSSAQAGDNFTYQITVVNNGTTAATGVTVEDILPSNLTFNSSTASKGSYNDGTGIWNIGSLGIGAAASLNINVTVDAIALPMTNFAQVKTANETDVDSTPDSNNGTTPQEDDEDSVVVLPDNSSNFVDLELTQTASKSTASVNDQIVYTISVTNKGPADAIGVTVADQLPSGLTFNTSTASKGTYNSTNGTWTIGNVAANETATLDINATVNNIPSTITNFAQVMTASPDDVDSTPGNDSNQTPNEDDEDSTSISPEGSTDIDLEATLTASNPNVVPWTNVDFTLEVTNNGAAAASGVVVDFQIPNGMAFTSKFESIGNYNLWTQEWNIGILQPNETAMLQLTLFTLNPGTDITAFAEVIAANETDIDSTPANGNGSSAVEDDEAATTLSNGGGGGKNDLVADIVGESSLLTVYRLYPVPTTDVVNILFTSKAETVDIYLYDYNGRILYHQTREVAQGDNTTDLDLTPFPVGAYFVSLETEEGSVRGKIVKQ